MYCYKCGAQIDDEAVVCTSCGCATKNYASVASKKRKFDPNEVSEKSRLVALLLCVFLGWLGVHRFYLGKIGTGVVWLLTGGCFLIGSLIDLIMIACGKATDAEGYPVTEWD